MSTQAVTLNSCGCCVGPSHLGPDSGQNPPALSAIIYRAGTFGGFRRSMLSALATTPGVAGLTTREPEDPAVGLVDAWSVALDVLTFYQERIANEGFLRTALERQSILQLAASIGYRLNPGVAAGAFLAFTVEDAIGAPDKVLVDTGTKAQSVPKQNQLPQMFETVEAIEARAEWNALRARATHPVMPSAGRSVLYIKGISADLKKGDVIVLVGDDRTLKVNSTAYDVRRVVNAEANPFTGYTIVTLNEPLGRNGATQSGGGNPKLFAMRQRAALFGGNAPDWTAMPDNIQAKYRQLPSNTPSDPAIKQWPNFNIAGVAANPLALLQGFGLFAEYFEGLDLDFTKYRMLRVDPQVDFDWTSTGSPDLSLTTSFSIRWKASFRPPADGNYWLYIKTHGGLKVWYNGSTVIDSWWTGSPVDGAVNLGALKKAEWRRIIIEYRHNYGDPKIQVELQRDDGTPPFVLDKSCWLPEWVSSVYLDAIYPKVQPGSWAVFSALGKDTLTQVFDAAEDARANFTLSAKSTRIEVFYADLLDYSDHLRETSVFVQSEQLSFAEQPLTTPISGNSIELNRAVDGLAGGRLLIVSGMRATDGVSVSELVTLDYSLPSGQYTTLYFTTNLQNAYVRSSVVVNSNVARATHGETRTELLGSGNGSVPFQEFTLKQKPLTFVSAATASGGASTLEIRVDNILWTEVPSLLDAAPQDRVYTTRISDAGDVTVQFGDGVNGARVPSGSNNVNAKYRVGIGLTAMLDANQINLLMSRPLGLKGVTNSLAPSGAADPEQLEDARRNAPFTVLTLDRIVSLRDYEDFARAYAGIGKAKASQIWEGEHTVVHITVASAAGGAVNETSDLYLHLLQSIGQARDPSAKVRVASFEPLPFGVGVSVVIDRPAYLPAIVLPAVKRALIGAYDFANREFAQPVTESEILAIIQRVPGVIAVRLNTLYSGGNPKYNQAVAAAPARWDIDVNGNPVLRPAQLATLDPNQIQIDEMKRP